MAAHPHLCGLSGHCRSRCCAPRGRRQRCARIDASGVLSPCTVCVEANGTLLCPLVITGLLCRPYARRHSHQDPRLLDHQYKKTEPLVAHRDPYHASHQRYPKRREWALSSVLDKPCGSGMCSEALQSRHLRMIALFVNIGTTIYRSNTILSNTAGEANVIKDNRVCSTFSIER